MQPISKSHQLSDPVATTGDRVYVISTQNGLFPDFTSLDHSTHEMWGVWNHPIKLLDGYWFALRNRKSGSMLWLSEATSCTVAPTYTQFEYRFGPWQVVRRDFVPDGAEGLIITLSVQAAEKWQQEVELLALFRSDLQPAWLGEEVGMFDQPDQATAAADKRTVIFTDGGNPWFAAVLASHEAAEILIAESRPSPQPTLGKGINAQFTLPLHFDEQGKASCKFFVAGSMHSEQAALATLALLQQNEEQLFADKQRAYQSLDTTSALVSPDEAINEAFAWSKINFQRHLRTVAGLGSGVGAGLPSYPWWFGIDSEYAVLPMLQAGQFETTKATLRLLKTASEKHNLDAPGLVVHEFVTNGVVYNPGNIVEVPVFVRAVQQTWQWTGDRAFLAEMYPFCKMALLDYALGTCDPDGDLCPSGRSIIETLEMHAGFECIDVAAYTWEALHALADLATAIGDHTILPELRQKAETLGRRIRSEWWLEDEGLFADVRASIEEVESALHRLEELGKTVSDEGFHQQVNNAKRWFAPQIQNPKSKVANEDQPWLLRHWAVMTPAEVGLATSEQAQRMLTRLESAEFSGRWGMYLHPERHDAMSINTGLLALSESRYGRNEQAQRIVSLLAAQLNLRTPGSISEALPDQWCFLQLWSGLGVISPVVEGFLGIVPDAAAKKLRVVPNLPQAWDALRIEQLRVAESSFDVAVLREANCLTVSVAAHGEAFELTIGAVLPLSATVAAFYVNGKATKFAVEETLAGRCVFCKVIGSAEVKIYA